MRNTGNESLDKGLLLVAHGKPSYWREATVLARSIRRFSPEIPIAVASDLPVPEREWRAAGFTQFVPYSFRNCGGLAFKLELDRISPYRDSTLFLDSDCICYADLSAVFAGMETCDFGALGHPVLPLVSGGRGDPCRSGAPGSPVLHRRLLSVPTDSQGGGGVCAGSGAGAAH